MTDYTQIATVAAVIFGAVYNKWAILKAARETADKLAVEQAIALEKAAVLQKEEAAVIAEKVKADLAQSALVNDKKLDTIHLLVNSEMGKKLLELAVALDKVAQLDPSVGNLARAKDAHAALDDHRSKQGKVDNKTETGFST